MSYASERRRRQIIEVLLSVLVIVIAVIFGGLLVLTSKNDPIAAYRTILFSTFGSPSKILYTLSQSGPLIIVSIGIMLAFKASFWNCGGEGQILLGAMTGLIVAYEANVALAPVSIFLGFFGAFLSGGLWAALSGFLKVRYRVDDIVSSFMLSLIAGLVVDYLVRVPFASPNHAMSALASVTLPASAVFPGIGGLNGVFILSLILAAFMYVVMTRTKIGFRIRVMGSNMDTAIAYFGKSYTNNLFILSSFISGGIIGIGGMTILSAFTGDILAGATSGAYAAGSFTNSYGFIAWAIVFLAGFNAIAIIPASIFFVALVIGGLGLLVINNIPSSLTLSITGITILFIAARVPIINQFNKMRRKPVGV